MKTCLTSLPSISPPPSISNMTHGGDGFDWNEYRISETFPRFVPVVEEGMWNYGVVEALKGTEKNYVVEESMGEKGAESMVGAAGSDDGRTYHWTDFLVAEALSESVPVVDVGNVVVEGLGKNGVVEGLGKNGVVESMVAAEMGSKRVKSGGSNEHYGVLASRVMNKSVVGVEASQGMVNLGNKRGAEWMGAAPLGARGSKRRRSPSGSIETSGGREVLDELAALANVCTGKQLWVKERERVWWDKVSRPGPGYTDADFKRDFHMSRSTFDTLCNILASSVGKENTAGRAVIPVPKRVAACVYRLATGESFRGLERRFGICISTCYKIIPAVTNAINAIFEPGSLSALWPHGADAMAASAAKFQALTGGIPGVIGAVYTSHVRIKAPQHETSNYYNRRHTERRKRKISCSVTLHAAVDADGAFTDLCLGLPGDMSDEKIFSMSPMSTTHVGEMVAHGKRVVGGVGYPLTDWTLVPYTHSNLTLPQNNYNEKVALARGVALDAFRRLKVRWAILQMPEVVKLDDFKSVMRACCVLHNLCERRGDELGDELKGFNLEEDDEMVLDNAVRSAAAVQVRDTIAHNLLQGSNMAVPATTK